MVQFSLRMSARRRARLLLSAATVALAPWTSAVQAAVFPVDDSASVVQGAQQRMQWRHLGPGRAADNSADVVTSVQLVLNTQPWAGKQGRIFMVLPPQPVRVQVVWRTRGITLPGSMQSGERALIFEGRIPDAIRDRIDVRVSVDGRELSTAQRLNFSYEIELP